MRAHVHARTHIVNRRVVRLKGHVEQATVLVSGDSQGPRAALTSGAVSLVELNSVHIVSEPTPRCPLL